MGTWGIGTFEDDTACDWLDELLEDPSVDFLRNTLATPDEGYIEIDQCMAFLAAAEIIAGVIGTPRPGLPDRALRVMSAFSSAAVEDLRAIASQKVRRVLAEHSEARELWEENQEDFPKWRDGVLDLCRRLEAGEGNSQ